MRTQTVLTDRNAKIIEMYYSSDYTAREIGQQFGLTEGSIRSILCKAKKVEEAKLEQQFINMNGGVIKSLESGAIQQPEQKPIAYNNNDNIFIKHSEPKNNTYDNKIFINQQDQKNNTFDNIFVNQSDTPANSFSENVQTPVKPQKPKGRRRVNPVREKLDLLMKIMDSENRTSENRT